MLGDTLRRRQKGRPAQRATRAPRLDVAKTWRIARIVAAATVPFVLGYVFAVTVLFPARDVAGQGIVVPALTGLSVDDARRELVSVGLGPVDVMLLPHPSAPAGTVTAQSPLAGQQFAPGQPVRVSVSSGAPHVVVPDVVGFPIERAASLLTRLGFQIRRVEETAGVERGRVLRLDPPPGAERALPASITIVVSAGLPPGFDPAADTVGVDTATAGPARR